MKANDLLDLMGEVEDEYIHDANIDPTVKTATLPKRMRKYAVIAACLALVVGIGSYILPRMGGTAGGGAAGHEEGSTFMSYAGPVFPLTMWEENNDISAERDITMDFAPWVPVWISNEEEAASRTYLTEAERQEVLETYNKWFPEGGYYPSSNDIVVTDSYTLTNKDTAEQTIRVLYPFATDLHGIQENRPILTVEGETLKTKLHVGSYAGSFQGAWENWAETHENPGTMNLQYFESWEEYQTLLADGTYLQNALGGFIDLSHIPVTVYEFTEDWGPKDDDDAGIPNPTIRVMFELDYEKTKVLSNNFHGGYYDRENGVMGKSFSIREEGERNYGVPCHLIVIGDDVENLQYEGYATGGWDTEETVEAGVTITRRETNLEEALRQAAGCNYQDILDVGNYSEAQSEYGFELYYGLLKAHLVEYGVLSSNGMERYDDGTIESLDVVGVSRVCWVEAEVTIAAGESVTLQATMRKEPSYDFHCAARENKGVNGYDMVTALGSNLRITGQTARLEDRGQIEIVRQNFGFDLINDIYEVELDMTNPHYYLEVREKEDKK